jgi:hypothetical protein
MCTHGAASTLLCPPPPPRPCRLSELIPPPADRPKPPPAHRATSLTAPPPSPRHLPHRVTRTTNRSRQSTPCVVTAVRICHPRGLCPKQILGFKNEKIATRASVRSWYVSPIFPGRPVLGKIRRWESGKVQTFSVLSQSLPEARRRVRALAAVSLLRARLAPPSRVMRSGSTK